MKRLHLSLRGRLVVIATFLIWLTAVIDPHGSLYGLRYLALIFAFTVILAQIIKARISVKSRRIFWFCFLYFVGVLPVYGTVLALLRGGIGYEDFIDTSYIAAGLIFFTALMYLHSKNFKVLQRSILGALSVLALLTVATQLIFALEITSSFPWFFVERNIALFGTRNYGGIEFPYIYYFSSPMLLIGLVYSTWNLIGRGGWLNFCFFALFITAFVLSGTRAAIVMSILAPLMTVFWHYSGSPRGKIYLAITSGIVILIFCVFDETLGAFFAVQEGSNATKIGYIPTYLEIFNDPFNFIFGQGFNAHVWSSETAELVVGEASKTELTYLEFLRVFGALNFIIFILLMSYLIICCGSLPYEHRWLAPALLAHLLISALNPYLFSTNGMLLLGFASALVSVHRKPQPLQGLFKMPLVKRPIRGHF